MRLLVFSPVLPTTMRRAQKGQNELLARARIQGSPKADDECKQWLYLNTLSVGLLHCVVGCEVLASKGIYACWLQVMEGSRLKWL